MNTLPPPDLIAFLQRHGAATAAQIGAALDVSQPTVSRMVQAAGEAVVRLGKARATRYALGRTVGRAGSRWPLFRITAQGQAEPLGQLQALQGDAYLFAAQPPCPAFVHGEFGDGVFPGLPWFLDDQRPQGFLGHAFARRVAASLGAPADLMRWQADDIVLALLHHGDDQPGDLVLGETALQRALQRIVTSVDVVEPAQRQVLYPQYAEAALRGEDIGSSAGGEQPKFTVTVAHEAGAQAVLVKFSEPAGTPAAQRWADLLRCEQLAGTVLRAHGLAAAEGEIVEAGGRVFLQSRRFDRTPQQGRRGFVSLAALDSAYYGHGRIDWWQFARQLQRDRWIGADDARRLSLYGWFGALIGNSDMHLGNAGLVLGSERPLALAPAYDMLPMMFRPASNGEVIERRYTPPLPTPDHHDTWRQAAAMALEFWTRVAQAGTVSADFRAIARSAGQQLARALQQIG